jgi:hypothetical protein
MTNPTGDVLGTDSMINKALDMILGDDGTEGISNQLNNWAEDQYDAFLDWYSGNEFYRDFYKNKTAARRNKYASREHDMFLQYGPGPHRGAFRRRRRKRYRRYWRSLSAYWRWYYRMKRLKRRRQGPFYRYT